MTIQYKYSEGDLLKQVTEYVNATYGQHYSQNKYQSTEFIIDGGHGIGFTVGNIMKYAQRYGRKGTPEDWRKDLMKVIHYAIIALHVHDKTQQPSLAGLYKDVKIEPALSTALSTVSMSDGLITDDTITITVDLDKAWQYAFDGSASSLLTTDTTSVITNTGTKTKNKKG